MPVMGLGPGINTNLKNVVKNSFTNYINYVEAVGLNWL